MLNKFRIKINKIVSFPKIQVVSVKCNDTNHYDNNLKIRSICLDESEILKRNEKKIIFYFPYHQNFSSEFLKFDLKGNLDGMIKKYQTYNFVMIGHTSKKDIEIFFLNNPLLRESSEFLMIDVLRLGEIQKYYGSKNFAIVLDEDGKVIYTNKNLIFRNFVKYFLFTFLVFFNFVYIQTVDDLINK